MPRIPSPHLPLSKVVLTNKHHPTKLQIRCTSIHIDERRPSVHPSNTASHLFIHARYPVAYGSRALNARFHTRCATHTLSVKSHSSMADPSVLRSRRKNSLTFSLKCSLLFPLLGSCLWGCKMTHQEGGTY